MPVRVPDPHWDRVHRALLQRIERRDRELLELHEDYLSLEQRCNALMGVIRRQAERDRIARANRAAKGANDE